MNRKIIFEYLKTLVFALGATLAAGMLLCLLLVGGRTADSSMPQYLILSIDLYLSQSEEGFSLDEEGAEKLATHDLWMQIIDADGNEVFAHNTNSDIPDAYTGFDLVNITLASDRLPGYTVYAGAWDSGEGEYTILIGCSSSLVTKYSYNLAGTRAAAVIQCAVIFLAAAVVSVAIASVIFSRKISAPVADIMEEIEAVSEGRKAKNSISVEKMKETVSGGKMRDADSGGEMKGATFSAEKRKHAVFDGVEKEEAISGGVEKKNENIVSDSVGRKHAVSGDVKREDAVSGDVKREDVVSDDVKREDIVLDDGKIRERPRETMFDEVFERIRILRARLAYNDKMRAEWVANISHDIKTPLSSIKGYGELLADADYALEEAEVRQFAVEILKAENTLEGLVDDLKISQSMAEGRFTLHKEKVELGELMGDCIRKVSPKLRGDSEILFSPPEPVFLDCDRHYMERCILNIISNAFVHNPGKKIAVRIRMAQENGHVTIRIGDNGKGMSQDEIAHAFERYYRGTASEQTEGTGLGLAIAKETVEAHGGSIHIESSVGEGTEFIIKV